MMLSLRVWMPPAATPLLRARSRERGTMVSSSLRRSASAEPAGGNQVALTHVHRDLGLELIRGIAMPVRNDDLVATVELRTTTLRELDPGMLAEPGHAGQDDVPGTRADLAFEQGELLRNIRPAGREAAPDAV